MQLKAIREENLRRADVLSTWSQAVREQLPGMATAVPAESMARHQHGTGVASPQSGAGARTVSFHSYASGPSENPQVLRDVINSAAAAGTVLIALCQRYAAACCSFLMYPALFLGTRGSHAASSQARQATPQAAIPKRAPRPFVTKSELEQCSSYLVGRWTQQKINAAIEELAGVHL